MFARPTLAVLLVATPALAQPAAPVKASTVTAATPSPDDRARQWLVLIDDRNYAQGRSTAAKAFQNRGSADAWAARMAAERESYGAVASRDLKSVDMGRTNTATVRYDTVFAHKAAAVETLTLAFENGGWSVTGYSVN